MRMNVMCGFLPAAGGIFLSFVQKLPCTVGTHE